MSVEASANNKKNSSGPLKKAVSFAMGTMASRILGLFRDLAMAALFDRVITDAFAIAFRLPNFFRRLLGEGSLASAFTPVWQKKRQIGESEAKKYFLQSLAVVFLLFLLLSSVFVFYAGPILKLFLHESLVSDPARFFLVTQMTQIMGGFVFFVGVSGLFSAFLQIQNEYGWTGFAPTLFNICMLFFVFLPGVWFGAPGLGLAWGVLFGGAAQFFILAWRIRRHGYFSSMQMITHWSSKEIWQFTSKLPMGFISVGSVQILFLVNSFLLSGQEIGTVSRLYWADRLLELPLTLVAVSLGTALLPTLSDFAARARWKEFSALIEQNLILGAFLVLPAAAGLWGLSNSIVDLLFYRGHFSKTDVAVTATILSYSACLLIFQSFYRILLSAFLALEARTWIIVASLAPLFLHLMIAPYIVFAYGIEGILGLTIFTSAVSFTLLFQAYLKKFSWGQHEGATREIVKVLMASIFMGLFLRFTEHRIIEAGDFWQACAPVFGGAIYLFVLLSLKSRVLRLGWGVMKSKFG